MKTPYEVKLPVKFSSLRVNTVLVCLLSRF